MSIRNILLYTVGTVLGIGAAFQVASLTATLPEGQLKLTKAPQPNGSTYWVLSQIHNGKPTYKGKMMVDCKGGFTYLYPPTQPTDRTDRGMPVRTQEYIVSQAGKAQRVWLDVIEAEGDDDISLQDPAENPKANIVDFGTDLAVEPINITPMCGANRQQVETAVLQVMTERLGVSSPLPTIHNTMTLQEQALTPRGREIADLYKLGASNDIAIVQMKPTDESGTYDFISLDGKKLLSFSAAPGLRETEIKERLASNFTAPQNKAVAYLQEKDGKLALTYVLSNGETIGNFDSIHCPGGAGYGAITKSGALGPWKQRIGDPNALPWCEANSSMINRRTVQAIGAKMVQQLSQNGKTLGLGTK